MAESYWPAGGDAHLPPQTHVLVGRSGVPIHEGNGQISFAWRKDLHGEHIGFSRQSCVGDIEFISAPRTRRVVGLGDLLAVQPYVRAVVNSSEIQPDAFALKASRQ